MTHSRNAMPTKSQRVRLLSVLVFTLAAGALLAPVTASATSSTLLFDGVLRSSNGGPASDGSYSLTFALYDTATGKTALWSEAATTKASGGQFSHALGSVKALDTTALADKAKLWIGVRVGQEPELPRQELHAALWAVNALHASNADTAKTAKTASALSCTGCVPVAALKITDNIDLGTYSLKAKGLTATTLTAQDVNAQTVKAGAFIGDGSKLTGVGMPASSCKAGLVVGGIAQDGTLKCVSTASTLPSDGLNEISNQLLTTQFKEAFSIPTTDIGKAIPDNTGIELVSTIVVGDVGLAETGVEVDVQVANSDLSKVSLLLLPPNDKKTGIVLCDPCGKSQAKTLNTTFPKPTATKTGDLSVWQGKSPKGSWNLRIKDTGFCIPQLDKLHCDAVNGTDGKLLSWSLRFGVASSKLVGVQGTLVVGAGGSPHTAAGGLTATQQDQAALVSGFPALWTLVVPSWAAQKSVATPGQIVYRSDLAKTFVMQGKEWRELMTAAMCGDAVRSGTEVCDTTDVNNKTCDSIVGSGSKGTLGCKTDCSGYDTSKCSTPPHFVGSKVLDATGISKVIGWYGSTSGQWVLCYRRSQDGASASTFHSKCNNKGPTMTLIKNNLGKVFGGYAPVSWKSKNGYVTSTTSFLFSVSSNVKFPYYKNPNHSMYDRYNYGPTWGGNHDLHISNNMTTGYANPGYSHKCPMCPTGACTACQNALAGNYSSWQITELEVWYRK